MTETVWLCPSCNARFDNRQVDGICDSCGHDFEADPTIQRRPAAKLSADDIAGEPASSADEPGEPGEPDESVRLLAPWGVIVITPGPTVNIGRHDDDFRDELCERPLVSRHHLRIEWTDQRDPLDGRRGVNVIDRQSTNGTFIDGVEVAPFKKTFARVGSVVHLSPDPDRGLELRIEDV